MACEKQANRIKLTSEAVAHLKLDPGESDRIWWDRDLAGFGFRVHAGGKRVWIIQYRIGTKQRRFRIGTFAELDATSARGRAKDMLAEVRVGQDPQGKRLARIADAALTLGSVIELYLPRAERQLKPRSFVETKRYLTVVWKPLHSASLAALDRKAIAARLSAIELSSGPVTTNRARSALLSALAWAIGEGLIDTNAVIGTNVREEKARERTLTTAELARIWSATDETDFGKIARLLILTGQRRGEVGGIRWSEIDLGKALWTIPAKRTKNGRDHDVPLSEAALVIIKSTSRRTDKTGQDRDLLFGRRDGEFTSWNFNKLALDGRLGGIPAYTLHDIRRSVSTHLHEAPLKIEPHIVEAVINHVSGHKAGVAGVYNRAKYATEKRAALERWAEHVEAIVVGRKQKVVAMPKRA
jgi:integrase